ncbi:MAG: hypothetical protein ABW128_00165 [Rhizorhabdus sp.]
MFYKQKAAALAAAAARNTRALTKLQNAISYYQPAGNDAALFDAMLTDPGVVGHLAMSNFAVRHAAQEALIDAVLNRYARIRRCRQIRHFFFTAAIDAGFTFLCGPMINLAALQRKIVFALNHVGLHAVCAFEIDVLSKILTYDPPRIFFDEPCRRILFHVHAITWTTDSAFKPVVAARELMKLRSYGNALGVPSIDICSRAQSYARRRKALPLPHRDQTAASMARMARYLLKAPIVARNYVPPHDGERGQLYDEEGAYNLKTALRMAELWSHIPAGNAVFGVGEGAVVADAYRQTLRDWAATQGPHVAYLDHNDIAAAWRRLWAQYPEIGFSPPLIRSRDA